MRDPFRVFALITRANIHQITAATTIDNSKKKKPKVDSDESSSKKKKKKGLEKLNPF